MGDEENPPVPSTSSAARRKEEKARKKDQRSWDNIMKSMGDMSEADKILLIKEKYTALYNDLRKTSSNCQNLEKKFGNVQKERDQAQSELNKNILAKAKLESLCRELQKQNKAIKDENITRVKEEEEKRREVATSFTERLNTLSSMMDENKDKSVRLRQENMNMTVKLTDLYNKFQERETHLADVNRQLDAQKDLFETKIKKMDLEYKADRKVWEEESKGLLSNLLKSQETNRLLEENVRSMQTNLDIYKNQYSDFEQTMTRSNEVFKTFHGEINKLQKSNNALEKERNDYVTRWQSCHNSIVEISEKNQLLAKKLELNEKKVATLEKLCRQLQAERTALHQLLQDKTEPPPETQKREDPFPDIKVSCSIPIVQKNKPKDNLPKKTCNGDVKSPDSETTTSDEEDEEEDDLISSLLGPTLMGSEHIDPNIIEPHVEITEIETGAAGDGTVSQLESDSTLALSSESESLSDENLESTLVEVKEPTQSETSIKEVRSLPIIKLQRIDLTSQYTEEPDDTSSEELQADSSFESLPLYKPEAVTDVPNQGGHTTLVKESEGRTNILEAPEPSGELEQVEGTILSLESESSGIISLKESEGKTDFKKE